MKAIESSPKSSGHVRWSLVGHTERFGEIDLGERAELDLEDGGFDDLTDEERAELDAALEEGLADIRAGRVVDAEEVFAKMRAARATRA